MKKLLIVAAFLICNVILAQKDFPNVNVKNLENTTISTSSFDTKDKIYVYSFWATWCAPCINELETINDVYEDWKKELNLEIIAVSTDDARTVKRVKPLVNGKGWNYTILLDTNQDLKRKLSISNVPYLLVVKNNKIVFTQNGHTPGGETELFNKLKSL